jgi:hypothetical protein
MVMMEKEVALEVAQGPVKRRCLLVNRDRRGEEKNKAGGRKSDACGARMRRSRLKAQTPRTRSKQQRESTVGVRGGTGRGEEGWTTRARITKGRSKWVVEGEGGKKRSEVARAKDAISVGKVRFSLGQGLSS